MMWILYSLLGLLPVLCLGEGPRLSPTRLTLNQTAGYMALLPCRVTGLDATTMVIWKNPNNNTLSINENIVTNDNRISITRPYANDWNLRITNLKSSDQGEYRCVLTTVPEQVNVNVINVRVAPRINAANSSSATVVREFDDASLFCAVSGRPKPTVTWFRKIKSDKDFKETLNAVGERITVYNISRDQAGTYECSAHNNVPPLATFQIKVDVQFKPEIELVNDRMIQRLARTTVMECTVRAFPLEVAVWRFNGVDLEEKTWKYDPQPYRKDDRTLLLSLEVRSLSPEDFGSYICYASNQFGTSSKKVELVEYKDTTPAPTTTTTTQTIPTAEPIEKTTSHLSSSTVSYIPGTPEYNVTNGTTHKYNVSAGENDDVVIDDNIGAEDIGYTMIPPRPPVESSQEVESGSSNAWQFGSLCILTTVAVITLI